jgi:hypothetical protein
MRLRARGNDLVRNQRRDEAAQAAQGLCGILVLISCPLVFYFDMLYSVAASYAGGMDDPLIVSIVFSAMGYPALAILVAVMAALKFRSTGRFTWGAYLVPVAYLAGVAGLIVLSDGAYL